MKLNKLTALSDAVAQFIHYCESGKHPKWATYLQTAAGAELKSAWLAIEKSNRT
jgi:hypothetical protein